MNVQKIEGIPVLQNMRDCWECFYLSEVGVLITNVHLPMDRKFRMPLTEHIASQTERLALMLKVESIVVGDFNTFPDDQGYEQTLSMQTGIYREATTIILDAENPKQRILETFSPYPYDVVPDSPNKYAYHLDHIFVSAKIENSIPICFPSTASDHFAISIMFKVK